MAAALSHGYETKRNSAVRLSVSPSSLYFTVFCCLFVCFLGGLIFPSISLTLIVKSFIQRLFLCAKMIVVTSGKNCYHGNGRNTEDQVVFVLIVVLKLHVPTKTQHRPFTEQLRSVSKTTAASGSRKVEDWLSFTGEGFSFNISLQTASSQ